MTDTTAPTSGAEHPLMGRAQVGVWIPAGSTMPPHRAQAERALGPDVVACWLALGIIGWGLSIALAHVVFWLVSAAL